MLNKYSMTGSRVTLRRLFIAAGLGALLGASGCGKTESPSLDSETHWLMSCDSDLDCGAGSCEYGVCTAPCASNDECSVLGIAGVECVAEPGVPGTSGASSAGESPAAGSACLLPCLDADDCSALGSRAVCESQRCELPASSFAAGVAGADSASAAVLCDGSEDVRFLWVPGRFGVRDYNDFAESRGAGFLVIDGQCRFWRASGATLPVSSGTLSADGAAAFETLIYDRFTGLASYDDQVPCISNGVIRLWSPTSRASCNCACDEDPELAGWLSLLEAMRAPQVQDLFADAQPVTGPLRLALLGYQGDANDLSLLRRLDRGALPWPLSRAPAENEIYYVPISNDSPVPDESWGVDIIDPGELAALRATQQAVIERGTGGGYTPLDYTDPETMQLTFFRMLLRDELPAPVQAALERPLF